MTDVDELVKRLRRLDYKTDLDEAAADTLERQAKWLEGFVKQSDEMAMALSSEATKSEHLFAENSKLRARIAELEAALESVLIGGNHLALLIGADHPLRTASHDEALAHYGAGDQYEIWCCWRTMMNAGPILAARAKLKGEK